MAGKISRRMVNALLAISTLLQVVAIITPWWRTDIQGNDSKFEGIFYDVQCFRDDCNASSIHDVYKNIRNHTTRGNNSIEDRLEIMGEDFEYHERINRAVFVTVALSMTVLIALAQVCILTTNLRTIVSATLMSFAAGLMVCVITNEGLKTDYSVDVRSVDSRRDHTYIDFPYSLMIFIASLVFGILSVAALISNTYLGAPIVEKDDDEYDFDVIKSYPPRRVIEVEDTAPIYQISSENVKVDEKGVDNPVFSEKL